MGNIATIGRIDLHNVKTDDASIVWRINRDNNELQKLLNAQNAERFQSNVTNIGKFQWQICGTKWSD